MEVMAVINLKLVWARRARQQSGRRGRDREMEGRWEEEVGDEKQEEEKDIREQRKVKWKSGLKSKQTSEPNSEKSKVE